MEPRTIYGLIVGAVLLIGLLSRDHVHQKLAGLLLFAWASTNAADAMLGFEKSPLIVPSLDALTALFVALVGYANRSRQALVVFVIYAIVGVVHIGAFASHATTNYWYYAIRNVLFLAQLLIVGGSGAWLAVHHWVNRRRQRLRPYPARR